MEFEISPVNSLLPKFLFKVNKKNGYIIINLKFILLWYVYIYINYTYKVSRFLKE